MKFAAKPLILAACLAATFPAAAGDWPNWLGPNQNGISDEVIEPEFGGVVWRAEAGTGFSSIAVAEGRAFTMGHNLGDEIVWCFDAETGAALWKHTYAAKLLPNLHEGGPAATPTIHDGKVYTLGKDGKAFCLEAETGQVVWAADLMSLARMSKPPEWGFAASPYLLGNLVILEAEPTIALDRDTGGVVWESRRFTAAYGSPALIERGLTPFLVTLKTEGLVVLDAKGETVATAEWRTSFNTNASTPQVFGDKVFVSTGYARGCGLFQFDGERLTKLYENESMSNHMNGSVLIDGHLYGFDGTAHRGPKTQFACVELATGKQKWREEGGLGCGSVIAAGKHLIILSERGELVLANASPAGLDVLTREQLLRGKCWTPPALANGRIYARNAEGDVVCVAVGR